VAQARNEQALEAQDVADQLVAKHGPSGALKEAYCLGYGLNSDDAKRCNRLAARGDETVLRSRAALEILRNDEQAVRQVRSQGMRR
jgi:hypothetical protein